MRLTKNKLSPSYVAEAIRAHRRPCIEINLLAYILGVRNLPPMALISPH